MQWSEVKWLSQHCTTDWLTDWGLLQSADHDDTAAAAAAADDDDDDDDDDVDIGANLAHKLNQIIEKT